MQLYNQWEFSFSPCDLVGGSVVVQQGLAYGCSAFGFSKVAGTSAPAEHLTDAHLGSFMFILFVFEIMHHFRRQCSVQHINGV